MTAISYGRWVAALLAMVALVACSESDPTPTPTATPTMRAVVSPTYTPTPPGAEQGQRTTAGDGDPVSIALSTPTPDPASAEPVEPTDTPVTTQVRSSGDLLESGRQFLRYGDYASAREVFATIRNDPSTESALRREAIYDLARAYVADGMYGEALTTLDSLDQELAANDADPGQFDQKEHFLRGEALAGLGRYGDAVAAYWQFLDAYPWMGEAVQPRIAVAYLALGDTDGAATAYRRAADEAGDRFTRADLLEDLAAAYVDGGRYGEAMAAYDEILTFAENAGYRADVQYRAGQALAAAGDTPGAVERWRAATEEAPASGAAYLALVELVNREVEFDLYQRGYIDLQAEAYLPAINAFQAYLDAVDPTDARAGNALLGLGQSYLGAGSAAEALPVLDRLIAEYAGCDCFGQAWLEKASAQAALGDPAGARRTYRTFARDYAADVLAPDALWQSGLLALGENNQLEAAVDLVALADAFPASDRSPDALYLLGMGAVKNQLYNQASQVLSRLQTGYPESRWAAVGYWLGRSYAAEGRTEEARAQWQALIERAPDAYYGVLAAYALADIGMTDNAVLDRMEAIAGPATRLDGDDGSQAFAEQWLRTWITDTVDDLATLPLEVSEDQNLARGRMLLELDRRGDALVALERVYEDNRENPRALYPLSLEFEQMGAYRLSLLSAVRLLVLSGVPLVEDGPIFIQRLAYPQPFAPLIEREARANGIAPFVFYSLIRQESLFEEGARSTAAAQGLAQIIPETGRWIAEQLGHPEYTNDIIYRPVINLRFGAYYLDWVRGYLDGNLVSALVGYNAGPGNSENWRAEAGADDTLFVETLTFTEPRIYVQLVVSNLYHYTRLYD